MGEYMEEARGSEDNLFHISRQLVKIGEWVIKVHLGFIFSWMLIGSAFAYFGWTYTPIAEVYAYILSPLSSVVVAIHPAASTLFSGPLPVSFYSAIFAETTVVTLLLMIVWSAAYITRYGSRPWQLMEQWGESGVDSVPGKAVILLVMGVFIAAGMIFITPYWFGFQQYTDPVNKPIELFQLGLWSFMASCSLSMVAGTILLGISVSASVIRSLFISRNTF
jgi:hypothetical protein